MPRAGWPSRPSAEAASVEPPRAGSPRCRHRPRRLSRRPGPGRTAPAGQPRPSSPSAVPSRVCRVSARTNRGRNDQSTAGFPPLCQGRAAGRGGQFALVHLDDRGGAAAGLEQLSREIVLPQIKVEQPHGLAGGGGELLDRRSRRLEAAGQACQNKRRRNAWPSRRATRPKRAGPMPCRR